jgi:hypothetical protein
MFNKSTLAFTLSLALPMAVMSFSGPANAADELTAEEVKALFSDKTFDIHNVQKDKDLQAYDSPDGQHKVYIPWKDKLSERKWWIEDNMHCTSHPKRGDSCKVIKQAGDGVYQGYTDGVHTHTLSNFRAGNQL